MLLVVITVILTLSVVLLIVPGLLYLQKHSEHNNHVTETVSLQASCNMLIKNIYLDWYIYQSRFRSVLLVR